MKDQKWFWFLLFTFTTIGTHAKAPSYSIDPEGVHIQGIDGSNPILYDNDWFTDVFDAYYIWARAHLGQADLRGVIVTRDMWDQPDYHFAMQQCIDDCKKALDFAKQAGLTNLPKMTVGADQALVKPDSGKIEDTAYYSSPGSRLVIAEAKKASREKPLVVIAGGPLTTVAHAILEEPSITDKMTVFSLSTSHYGYNGKDGWSAYIVAKKTYLVEWAAGQFWDKNSVFRYEHFKDLPENPLANEMKRFIQTDLGKANQLGDGAPLVWMFENRCWTDAEVLGAEYSKPAVRYEKGKGADVLTIPKPATDLEASRNEFFKVMNLLFSH